MKLVYTVEIDKDFEYLDNYLELLEAVTEEEFGCNVVRSKLETPDEIISKGEWEDE
ncbi:hypothetical protein R2R35_14090 [Anaerocolumna sp. AGMB13020]|uniref:hypothetical protein n=1 Tax=Anaerocolumna sp. AGMB13020 TaxID=3081750 RepID=UPI0029540373|nr:hypothetical protein [Anaerocolumna sp. AGMB13020]WOO34928.1 hypothetical protein R2R35_14090 [Anaerocolumna sp. AGMB13020]